MDIPSLGLDCLAFESRLFIEAKSHAEVSIGCNEIGIEVLIGKIEGVSNVGEAMIVIIRREIFRKSKGKSCNPSRSRMVLRYSLRFNLLRTVSFGPLFFFKIEQNLGQPGDGLFGLRSWVA